MAVHWARMATGRTTFPRTAMEVAQAMREISLREYQRSPAHTLSADERDMLKAVLPSATIETAAGAEGIYHLTPGSVVGAVEVGALSVLLAPKIGIPNLLSLACYAISRVRFGREAFEYPKEYALLDVLAMALATQARRAFSSGLLHGYRPEEQALLTVRGRINFEEQLRRRFDSPLPADLQYHEFTDDILANQLVKAAAYRLGRMRLRSPKARESLGWMAGMLAEVSLVEFRPASVPVVTFDRLNGHYRRVVELSRLILRQGDFESGRGQVRASGFLMDMNAVFQEFLTLALREAMGVSERILRSDRGVGLTLEYEEQVALKPDLTCWDGSSCTFVGDAKYKNVTGERVPNADLYQLVSYASALDLPGGLLVYAEGETDTATYNGRRCGKRLEVAALDISRSLDEVLADVRRIAEKVVSLRQEARAGLRSNTAMSSAA